MVSSNQPPPKPSNAITDRSITELSRYAPCCLMCDTPFENILSRDEHRWCKSCRSFQKSYRGPKRDPLCRTCFNCVDMGRHPHEYVCAALKYQMPDGTWRDRYNQDHSARYFDSGMRKVNTPLKPDKVEGRFDCECYEYLEEGMTREKMRIQDPLRFYDRSRFF